MMIRLHRAVYSTTGVAERILKEGASEKKEKEISFMFCLSSSVVVDVGRIYAIIHH